MEKIVSTGRSAGAPRQCSTCESTPSGQGTSPVSAISASSRALSFSAGLRAAGASR